MSGSWCICIRKDNTSSVHAAKLQQYFPIMAEKADIQYYLTSLTSKNRLGIWTDTTTR